MSAWNVYFVRGGGRTKVGAAKNVDARLAQLQACSPWPLELVYQTPGGKALEAALHRALADRRVHGEWFEWDATPEEASGLVASCQGAATLTQDARRRISVRIRNEIAAGELDRAASEIAAVEDHAAGRSNLEAWVAGLHGQLAAARET